MGPLELDFHKFDDLADEDDKVKLALEAVRRAVNVETLRWLLASLDKVINDLGLDLQLMLKG